MGELIRFIYETLLNLESWVNRLMIALIDGALIIWPSTPSALMPSQLLAQAQTAMPAAPWFLLGDFLQVGGSVVGLVAAWKVAGMVRGA